MRLSGGPFFILKISPREVALTGLEAGNRVANLQDDSGTLMPESIIPRHDHRANTAMFPEMHV
jgi:hypothetical protein